MKEKTKILSILVIILLIIVIVLSILLFNKNTYIIKMIEEKEQLITEDGVISTTDHLAQMASLETVIETEDNWKLWAQKAGITIGNYANINELLADTTAVTTLSNSTVAVDYMMTSQDTNNCIRQKILDNTNAMIIMLKSSYAKSKILENDSWRSMILARNSLVTSIIDNGLYVTLSSTAKRTNTTSGSASRADASITTQTNDLILKIDGTMNFESGGASSRTITLLVGGKSIGSQTQADYSKGFSYSAYNTDANKGQLVTVAVSGYVSWWGGGETCNIMVSTAKAYILR